MPSDADRSGEEREHHNHHPEDERPRMDVDVIDATVSASAEAVTRPVSGRDYPKRTGEVSASVTVTVECLCGNDVRLLSIQGGATCQGCGRRWELE